MAIEFLVDLACPVKRELTAAELAVRLRARSRAEVAIARAREAGDARPPEELVVKLVRADGEGGERVEAVSLASILEGARGLDDLASACAACRARVVKSAFGCYGAIGYPILAETEAYLMDRMPPMLGTLGGAFLVRAVRELGYDGAPVARMRAEGRTFFERERPVATRYAEDEASWEITSDAIWEMLLFPGPAGARAPGPSPIRPSHALLVAVVLGIVPHAVAPEHVQAVLADDEARAALLEPVFVPPELRGTQIEDLGRLLEAVRKGVLLGCPVLVDA
ncbi:MAG TPA: hypothetical protein VHB21_24575 [Minicystis sp.]|nr:hypothetical protein [Minicystis sp.]